MSRSIVIVGGGVIGLCCALSCLRRGHRVTVVERAPDRRGASLGNAGMIVPSHFTPLAAPGAVSLALKWMWNPESPFYLKSRWSADLAGWALQFWRAANRAQAERAEPVLRDLHLASRDAHLRLAADGDDFGLTTRGLLMLCRTEKAMAHEAAAAARARALGVPADVLNPAQTAALDPGATFSVAGSVHYPLDCHLDPARFVASLERRVAAAGGEFAFGADATGWHRDGSRLAAVATDRGPIDGDEFVLAGGAWSPALVRDLGLRLPMEAGKGYSLTVPDPVERPQLCALLAEARVAVTPLGNAVRFGGTMEFSGLDESIDPRRVAGIVRAIPQYYPAFRQEHFAALPAWSGLRPCSPDGLPYLGRSAAAPNLIVATGHAMMGLSLAPVTGEIVAALADNSPAPLPDLHLLHPDRFASQRHLRGPGFRKA